MFAMIFESLRIAFSAIWANKVRSFLTMLGIIIGVFAVIELVAVGEGVKAQVSKEIQGLGTNVLAVLPGKISEGGFNPASSVGASTLTDEDLQTIKDNQFVQSASAVMLVSTPVKVADEVSSNYLVMGVEPAMFSIRELGAAGGRFFNDAENADRKRVAVLGYPVWQHFFGEEAFGEKTIEMRGEQFTVIGVLPKPKTQATLGGPSFDDAVYLPFATAADVTKTNQIFRILVKAKDADSVKPAVDELKTSILANHKGSEDFSVLTQEETLNLLSSVLGILTAMLSALGGIALLVGGIGIMNIMLVSVTERTREIGIRKAVGASTRDIFLQFLIESVMLSVMGGVVALGLAFVGAGIVEAKSGFSLVISAQTSFFAIGFAVLVGIIFGVAPALRAARLDPVRALRYE